MFDFNVGDLMGWLLFGAIGMIACGWGKLKDRWQPWVIGIALMVFPYFITGGPWMWGIGTVLTILIFFAKD